VFYMLRRFFLKFWLRDEKGNGAQLCLKNCSVLPRIGAEEDGTCELQEQSCARCNAGWR
jgi:hypothetical protein